MKLNLSKIKTWMRVYLSLLIMFGCTPPYYFIWITWRFVSLFLPSHIYQAVDDILYATFQSLVLFFVENAAGSKIIFYGDAKKVLSKKERVLYMSNHQSNVDWILTNLIASRQGSMGQVRFILKDVLQLIPMYGFCDYLHGMIHINRKSFNSEKMLSSLKYLQNEKIPSWVVIYPEGTFYNLDEPEAIEQSKKYAEDRGEKPFQEVLYPRHRGLYLVLKNLKDYFDSMYDVTIIYSCAEGNKRYVRTNAPTFMEFITKGGYTVHIHINRLNINAVPTNEDGLKNWLLQTFRKKDIILESYIQNQPELPSDHVFSRGTVSPSDTFRNTAVMIFFLVLTLPYVVTSYGRTLYLKGFLYGVLIGYIWMALTFFQ